MESYLQKRAQLLRNYLLDNYLISVADHEDFWDFYLFFSDKKVGFQFSIARRLTSASLELEGRKYAFNRHLRLLAHNQLLPAMADKLSRWLDLKNPGDGLDHSAGCAPANLHQCGPLLVEEHPQGQASP